jgi:hypothetical protein
MIYCYKCASQQKWPVCKNQINANCDICGQDALCSLVTPNDLLDSLEDQPIETPGIGYIYAPFIPKSI